MMAWSWSYTDTYIYRYIYFHIVNVERDGGFSARDKRQPKRHRIIDAITEYVIFQHTGCTLFVWTLRCDVLSLPTGAVTVNECVYDYNIRTGAVMCAKSCLYQTNSTATLTGVTSWQSSWTVSIRIARFPDRKYKTAKRPFVHRGFDERIATQLFVGFKMLGSDPIRRCRFNTLLNRLPRSIGFWFLDSCFLPFIQAFASWLNQILSLKTGCNPIITTFYNYQIIETH